MKVPPMEQTQEALEPRRPKKRRRSSFRFFRWLVAFLMIVGAFCAVFYLYLRYAQLPPNQLLNTSKIAAADGSTLTNLVDGSQKRIKVSLRDIPPNLINATIAVEDHMFYQHGGFDPQGIARALLVDLKSGSIVEGGSTITQQLAKNLFLTQDQTIARKVKEATLTLQLEMAYSKDEILEQYLNVIYYGQGAYGIESAAETYFGKRAKDLSLAEAAMLAGIPKGPSLYDPYLDLHAAKNRQRVVLDMMVKDGKITQSAADDAFKQELDFAPQKSQATKAPYFTDYVMSQLKSQYNITSQELYRGGLDIDTTLDPQMQKAAEDAVQKEMKSLPPDSELQVSLIAMDPNTGDIKAMVGGRNYSQSSYNRTLAPRQPGSSFKPIVYLTALHNKYTPATRIKSEHRTFDYTDDHGNPKTYDVHNFGDIYAGDYLSFRQAIARSDNIFAVTTAMDIGPEKVVNTARALGITAELKPYPSLALGVFPVAPIEMIKAYAPLANGGYKVEPHAINRVEDTYTGDVKSFSQDKQEILDPGAAFVLTNMMKSVVTDPHGTAYRVHDTFTRPVAAKTGTTDTDAWIIGYTPELITAVWIGYDKDQLVSPTESYLAAPIWADFMKAAHQNLPVKDFPVPDDVTKVTIDEATGLLAAPDSPQKQEEYFLKGSEPTETDAKKGQTSDATDNSKKTSSGSAIWNWITGKSP